MGESEQPPPYPLTSLRDGGLGPLAPMGLRGKAPTAGGWLPQNTEFTSGPMGCPHHAAPARVRAPYGNTG